MAAMLPACLRPTLRLPMRLRVHSIFERVVNLTAQADSDSILISLVDDTLPRVPDSLRVPGALLRTFDERDAFQLQSDALVRYRRGTAEQNLWQHAQPPIADRWTLIKEAWTGRIHTGQTTIHPLARLAFFQMSEGLPSGMDRLPIGIRSRALAALMTPQAVQYIGLGPGLTPSYDDMLVGVMAVNHRLGKPIPYELARDASTTEVSMRYLLQAREGYVGEPLLKLLASLWTDDEAAQNAARMERNVSRAVEQLLRIGATSGADMIRGVREAIKALAE